MSSEPTSPYAGQVTAYDSPIFIADAAMYLMATDPSLGINDPYELDQEQFDAAVALLQQQSRADRQLLGAVHGRDRRVRRRLDGGRTAWPVNFSYAELDAPVDAVEPTEGMTGWADTWMISANAPHPNCMLMWMDWTLQPDVQAEVAEYYGAAGSNADSCDELRAFLNDAYSARGRRSSWTRFATSNCGDAEFLNSLYLWKTPQVDCGDDRGEVCIDYSEWTQAWTEIRGA